MGSEQPWTSQAWTSQMWAPQACRVAEVCASMKGLVGVYVHGSAALGGFTPASDLDVLVVAEGPADGVERPADWQAVGEALLRLDAPYRLELSMVSAVASRQPEPPYPFFLHVATPGRMVFDDGAGDTDLLAHYAVTRLAGIALMGPPPGEVIGAVDPRDLLASLRQDLAWALDHADARYAVLNACRAVAFAEEGRLLSKLDGGAWWTDRHGPCAVVEVAMAAHRHGVDLGSCNADVRGFVTAAAARLQEG